MALPPDYPEKTNSIRRIAELRALSFFIPANSNGNCVGENEIAQLLNELKPHLREYYRYGNPDCIDPDEPDETEFYRLPPLVVKRQRCNDFFEVIEGGDRLVAIYLILTFLDYLFERNLGGPPASPPFILKYETKNRHEEFVRDLKNPFISEDPELPQPIRPHPDCLNLFEMWETIENWYFSQKDRFWPVNWATFLKDKTCFRWHEAQ